MQISCISTPCSGDLNTLTSSYSAFSSSLSFSWFLQCPIASFSGKQEFVTHNLSLQTCFSLGFGLVGYPITWTLMVSKNLGYAFFKFRVILFPEFSISSGNLIILISLPAFAHVHSAYSSPPLSSTWQPSTCLSDLMFFSEYKGRLTQWLNH